MTVYTSADNFGSASSDSGVSWKLIRRYTYGYVEAAGFCSYESAQAYNVAHFTDPSSTCNIGQLCHVFKGASWERVYRDEDGNVIGDYCVE